MAYGWDNLLWAGTRQQMIRENVVDVVFNPALNNEYQNTFLNSFHGQAFRMHSTLDEQVLLDDLAAAGVRNFFWSGHGSEKSSEATLPALESAQRDSCPLAAIARVWPRSSRPVVRLEPLHRIVHRQT